MKELNRLLDELERVIDNNAKTHAATMDETLQAARRLTLLREAVGRGAVDPLAARFAIEVTIDSLAPMLRDVMSARNGLCESHVRQARARLGADATQEDIAAELGSNSRTLRRLFSYNRQLDGIPAKKGRPRAPRK